MAPKGEKPTIGKAEAHRIALKKSQRKRRIFVNKISNELVTYIPLFLLLFAYIIMWRDNKATMLVGNSVEAG